MISTSVDTKELLTILQSLQKTKAKAAIRKGCRAGAKIIASQEKADAPRLTGVLASNIKVRAMPRSRKWVGARVVETSDHAGFTEFETKHSKKDKHKYRDAADKSADRAMNECIKIIGGEVDKALEGK